MMGGSRLARAWRADPHTPSWARRYSANAWAPLLAAPARHGWVPRDLNQLVSDWIGVDLVGCDARRVERRQDCLPPEVDGNLDVGGFRCDDSDLGWRSGAR
jgi:hypothetical protein